jgi:CRP-like cAMP-binding protein
MTDPHQDPSSTGSLYEIAIQWELRGDPVNALRYHAETLRLNPDEPRARRGIGAALAKLGRNQEAMEILRFAIDALGRRGNWLAAIAAGREAVAIDPRNAELNAALVALYDAFTSVRRRRRRPPPPPQPLAKASRESIVMLTDENAVIARAIEVGMSYEEQPFQPALEPPFFAGISRESFLALLPKMISNKIDRGTELMVQASLTLVVAGELTGEAKGLRHRPGSALGYRSLVDEQHPAERARADIPSEVLEMRRSDLEDVVREHPPFAAELADYVKQNMLRALLDSPMLGGLPTDARIEILGSFTSSIVAGGAAIIREGERASGLYLIGSGQVQITRDRGGGEDDTAEIAAVLGAGEVFGEIALLEYRPATATAIAIRKTVLFHLERARYVGLTARHPELRNYLVELARSRISENLRPTRG